jgi:hypothetical protein
MQSLVAIEKFDRHSFHRRPSDKYRSVLDTTKTALENVKPEHPDVRSGPEKQSSSLSRTTDVE